jgi:hypothetical protein
MTSPNALQKTKLVKEEIPVVDLDLEMGRPFLLPKVVTEKDFLEKAAILGMDDESGRDQIIEDSAGLLRMLETVLVLREDRSNRRNDLEKLKAEYVK